MPLDPNIILGAKPAQFDLAQFSPMNAMTSAMKFKQAGQEGELNALKLKEAQAALTERNALRGLDPTAADYESQLFKVSPQLGIQYRKEAATTGAQKAAQAKSEFDLKAAQGDFLSKLKRELSSNPSDANVIAFGEDAAIQGLYTPAQVKSTVDQLLAMPPQQRVAVLAKSGASAADLKPPAPPTPLTVSRLIKERDALLPGDPNIAIYNDAIKKETQFAPRAVTNVNIPSQEKAEQVDRGKMLVEQYKDISKAAGLAAKTLPSIDTNLSILNKGFSTGFGTETVAAGAKVLAALGVADADKFATNAQVFQAKATEAVLQKQLEQKGPQTESDAQRIDQIGAQLGKTTAGNKFVLTTAKEQLKRDMEQRNFYDKWWQKNKTYDGAEDAWFSGEGGKSLFDRPALKTYSESESKLPKRGAAAPVSEWKVVK